MKLHRRVLYYLAGIYLTTSPSAVIAEIAPQMSVTKNTTVRLHGKIADNTAPTVAEQVILPDWQRISFSNLPPIIESGGFQIDPASVQQLGGYDSSRSWSAGQTADQILKLGDFADSLQLQKYNLGAIAAASGQQATNVKLSDLQLMSWQKLGDLATTVPGLAEQQVANVAPIRDLLSQYGVDETQAIAQVLQNPDFAQLSLGQIDLSQYTLDSIPGLDSIPLEQFQNWEQSVIAGVPGLKNVPFSQFFDPDAISSGMTAMLDVVYGPKESNRTNTISGSDQQGFNVPCTSPCPHIELGSPLLGKQWIAGVQQVEGGVGALAAVNGGKEPTGRHPFGNAFKVVLTNTDESTGTAEFSLYFRACDKLGCTPYFIGPVPWMTLREKDLIFLGFFDGVHG